MTVISTVEETEITVIGAEAAALITTKVVGGVDMTRTGAAEVGLMEGRTFSFSYLASHFSPTPCRNSFHKLCVMYISFYV